MPLHLFCMACIQSHGPGRRKTREHTVGLSVLSTGVWGRHPWILIDHLYHPYPLKNPVWTPDNKIIPDHPALKMACIFATCTACKSRFNQTLSYLLGSKWTTKQCYPFCNNSCFMVILPPHWLSTKQFTTFTFAPQERLSGDLTGPATSWWWDDLFSLILINRGLVITNVCTCMLVSPSKTIHPSAIRNCLPCLTSEEYLESEPTKSETFRWRNDQ